MLPVAFPQAEAPRTGASTGTPTLWTFPNVLSLHCLLVAVPLAALVVTGNQSQFTALFLMILISDIIDGLIPRMFQLLTTFGARLDSLADTATQWEGLDGVLCFAWSAIPSPPGLAAGHGAAGPAVQPGHAAEVPPHRGAAQLQARHPSRGGCGAAPSL
jgi:hypothetical protein